MRELSLGLQSNCHSITISTGLHFSCLLQKVLWLNLLCHITKCLNLLPMREFLGLHVIPHHKNISFLTAWKAMVSIFCHERASRKYSWSIQLSWWRQASLLGRKDRRHSFPLSKEVYFVASYFYPVLSHELHRNLENTFLSVVGIIYRSNSGFPFYWYDMAISNWEGLVGQFETICGRLPLDIVPKLISKTVQLYCIHIINTIYSLVQD